MNTKELITSKKTFLHMGKKKQTSLKFNHNVREQFKNELYCS